MSINLSKGMGSELKIPSVRNPMIEIVLLIVVSAIFTWFIILPKKSEVADKQQQLNISLKEEAQIEGQRAKLQDLIRTLKASKEDVGKLDESLPLEGRITRFHFLVQNLAQSVGVTTGNISVSSPSTAPAAGDKSVLDNPYKVSRQLQKMSGSISVFGNFNQLKAFLEKLEKSSRLIDISDLNLESGPNGALNLRLTVDTYYFGK